MQWPKMNVQETADKHLLEEFLPVFNCVERVEREIEAINNKSAATFGFGYCPVCNTLTPSHGYYGLEDNRTKCLKCGSNFGWDTNSGLTYLTGNDIPASMQEKAKICNSKIK